MTIRIYPSFSLTGNKEKSQDPVNLLNRSINRQAVLKKQLPEKNKEKEEDDHSNNSEGTDKPFSSDPKTLIDILQHGNINDSYYYQTIVKPKLNLLNDIQEKEIDEEFMSFNFLSISSSFVLFVNLILSIFLLPIVTVALTIIPHLDPKIRNSRWVIVVTCLAFFSCVSAIVTGWMLYSLCMKKQNVPKFREQSSLLGSAVSSASVTSNAGSPTAVSLVKWKEFYDESLKKHRFTIQRMFIISLHLTFAAKFMQAQLLGKHCPDLDTPALTTLVSNWVCAARDQIPGAPTSATLILILGSFVFCIAMREPRWWVSLLLHTISLVVFLAFFEDQLQPIFVGCVVGWWLAGALLFLDLHKQMLITFFTTNHLRVALLDNAKYAEQVQANEMKHMIANVAHDLKTPLASFTSGMELISHVLNDSRDYLQHHLPNCQDLNTNKTDSVELNFNQNFDINLFNSFLTSIESCLQNLRSTNTFMIMAINRCIDYTKASKGFKLVPRYDTIHLQETLELPLNCMKNIQDQCKISLLPLPPEICKYVITDKQWLQENVLCLLSNAVKYSTAGTITVNVSMLKIEDIPQSAVAPKPQPAFSKTQNSVSNHTASLTSPRPHHDDPPSFSIHRVNLYNNHQRYKLIPPANRPTSPILETAKFFNRSAASLLSAASHSHSARTNHRDEDPPTSSSHSEGLVSIRPYGSTGKARPIVSRPSLITQFLKFEIEDNGIGMSEEAMATLFNPFKQTQRLAGGTGLGLFSLAKRLEALHGKYGVEKRKDGKQGSLFWFAIPYRPDETVQAATTVPLHKMPSKLSIAMDQKDDDHTFQDDLSQVNIESCKFSGNASIKLQRETVHTPTARIYSVIEERGDSESPNPSPTPRLSPMSSLTTALKILIVDDSQPIVKMSSMLLRRQGHTIDIAQNGEVALKSIEDQWSKEKVPFDIILMDLQMPVMDGLEATRRLRQLENEGRSWMPLNYHHRIIGMSANSDHDTTNDAYESGVDSFMPKPFSMELFNQTVKELLQETS